MKVILVSLLLLVFPRMGILPDPLNGNLAKKCEAVAAKEDKMTIASDRTGRVKTSLHRLYNSGDTLLFPLEIQNRSSLSFEVDFIRFYLRDRKSAKRTVTQELEILPLYTHGLEKQVIPAFGRQHMVFALGKLIPAADKIMAIEVYEKNGGRHLYLQVRQGAMEHSLPLGF